MADESAACSVALTKQRSIDKCVEGSSFGCSGTVANKTMWTKVRAVRHYSAPPQHAPVVLPALCSACSEHEVEEEADPRT